MPSPSPSQQQLLAAASSFLVALASNTHPLALLTHFSTTNPVSVQHYPATCPNPRGSLLRGTNAVRSYFDLLATHWTRSALQQHSFTADVPERTVVLVASVVWTWKRSGRSWVEDFTCTLVFDDAAKIVSLTVRTDSGPGTCVLRAVDAASSNSNTNGAAHVRWISSFISGKWLTRSRCKIKNAVTLTLARGAASGCP